MLAEFWLSGGIVKDIVIGAAGSILAAIVSNLTLMLFRRMIGWSRTRIRLVSIATGLFVALVCAVAIGYNWRSAQQSGTDTTQQASPEPSPSATPQLAGTPSPAPSSTQIGETTPVPIMTEAPPTFVEVDYGLQQTATTAVLRAYLASEPEALNDRNAVLGYVDHVFFATDNSRCHNGQVSEFDEHRSYDAWRQQIKNEITHWRDDVPLTFRATLGTYDFEHHVLPLQLNPQGLVAWSGVGNGHCSFTVPVHWPFGYNDYFQIAPGTVPQSLAVTPARGEQILNLAGGRNVTVALHGAIQTIDPHFAMNGASGYGTSYQPTEVTVRSGMVPIYHALIRGSK